MNENIITIYDNENNKKDYKILLIIEKEYYYIIYTDLKNTNIKKNLNVVKVSSLDKLDIIPMNNNDWKIVETEYKNLINEKTL